MPVGVRLPDVVLIILVFAAPPLFWFIGRKKKPKKTCPLCERPLRRVALFCSSCGTALIAKKATVVSPSLNVQKVKCPSCLKPLTSVHERFCAACGFDVFPQCPRCDKPMEIGDSFCHQCGYSIGKNGPPVLPGVVQSKPSSSPTVHAITMNAHSTTSCPYCCATRTSHDAFCGSCGKSF